MSSIALFVITLTLGLFFIFIGQFKVTPKFFPDIHDDMVKSTFLNVQIHYILFN